MQQNDPSISFSDTLVCNNKPSVTYCLFLQCEPFKRKRDYKRNWHTGKGVHNIVYELNQPYSGLLLWFKLEVIH